MSPLDDHAPQPASARAPSLQDVRRVLVTGGAGFIGSNLVRTLVARGVGVAVLDDFSTGRRENLEGLDAAQVELFEGDLCDAPLLARALRGCDAVLHQAARPSVQRSLEDPAATHRVNVDGTLAVLMAARAAGVRRVVLASSSSVYGNGPELPKHEALPLRPASPYAASKLAGEAYARAFHESYGLQTVCLRYFNVFGPRQDPASQYAAVIPRFMRAALRGDAPVIYGDGEQTRDFTFVDNVVDANLRALVAPAAGGRALNVAAGARTSLRALVAQLGALVGRALPIDFQPAREGEVKHSQADVSAAREALGYAPTIALDAGLRCTLAWYAERIAR